MKELQFNNIKPMNTHEVVRKEEINRLRKLEREVDRVIETSVAIGMIVIALIAGICIGCTWF